MRKLTLGIIAALVMAMPLLAWSGPQGGGTAEDYGMSKTAFDYVLEAVGIMKEHSFRTEYLDWGSIRAQMLEKARGAQETTETYDALRLGVKLLGDRHSMFRPPPKPKSETAPFRAEYEIPMPKGKILKGGIAYLWIPHFGQPSGERITDFADVLHTYVRTLHRYGPKAWIVDLRDNGGGNMWPMVAGVGPLLGEGEIGYFTFRGKTLGTWKYEKGSAGMHKDGQEQFSMGISGEAMPPLDESAPIAVLIGPHTASSGEATLTAFLGKENVRTFGMPTYGVPSANKGHELSDGAMLIIPSTFYSDRLMREYSGSIPPDRFVPFNALAKDTRDSEDDPVIKKAREWIGKFGEEK